MFIQSLRFLFALVLAIGMATPQPLRAQETGAIVIHVTDAGNGAPIDNAQVFLLGQDTPQSSLTNAQGVLIFDVQPGSYRLIVKASSYNDSGSFDVSVEDGQRVQVAVKLQLREIAHVVSHGSGTSTVTIDDSSAQRKVSQTLSDALNKIAGVTVDTVDYGANSAFNISLHGNDASRTGYSIDGMRVNGAAAQAVGGLQDLFSGSSIDFSPNAASAGGTVNFYTLQPSKLWTYHATGLVGNYSNTLGTFAFTGGSGRFSFAFERSAGGQDDPLDGKYYADASGQSYVHAGGWTRTADLAKVSLAVSPVSTLRYTVMGGTGNSQYICSSDTTLLPCGTGPNNGNHNANIFQTLAFGSLAGHVQFNIFTNLGDYRYGGSEPDRSINGIISPYSSSGKFPFENEGLYLSTSARRHTISGGAYFSSASSSFASTYNGSQTLTGTRTTHFQNIWFSDRVKTNDKLALTHGLSQAAGTGTGSSLVLSETATWQPATADTFELQGSVGSSYPSAQFASPMSDPASADMDCFNKSTFVQGPADEPVHQSSSTYDLGYKHTWKRGFVSLDAYRNNSFGDSMQVPVPFAAEPAAVFPNGPAAYLNQLQQIWAQPTVCGSIPFDPRGVYIDQLTTGLGQVSQGVTLSAQYALGRNVVLFPSYATTSAYISNADPRLTMPGGIFLPYAQLPHHPLHTAGLILDGILARRSIEWIADAQFTSADNPQNLPAYTVYNGGLVFHGQYGSLQLLVSNVFGTHTGLFSTYQGVNPTPVAGGGTFAYATTPLPPRGITVQYDVRWKQHTSPPKPAASPAPKPKT
ncbi:MAG TPA: TonB-dependent receptor [Candidatus Baltobacteraceae bacterium]|nr:TonB-dependent receptor [Candidatus Baltobacteraceae bacterium]